MAGGSGGANTGGSGGSVAGGSISVTTADLSASTGGGPAGSTNSNSASDGTHLIPVRLQMLLGALDHALLGVIQTIINTHDNNSNSSNSFPASSTTTGMYVI